jgi:hypothetical protein
MKYRFTILNITALLYLAGCIIYTLINYPVLSQGEGWGLAFMVGLFVFGLTAFVVDLIIQWIWGNKQNQQTVCIIVLAVYVVLFFLGTKS